MTNNKVSATTQKEIGIIKNLLDKFTSNDALRDKDIAKQYGLMISEVRFIRGALKDYLRKRIGEISK